MRREPQAHKYTTYDWPVQALTFFRMLRQFALKACYAPDHIATRGGVGI